MFFFYGSLRPGHAPPEIAPKLAGARHIGPGKVRGRLLDLGEFTGVVLDTDATTTISGELMELPDDPQLLRDLDAYEGFDPDNESASLFVRESVPVALEDGRELLCSIYRYNGAGTD